MRDNIFDYHVQRLKTAVLDSHTAESVPEWICKHTRIAGQPFSFLQHEYQDKILRDTSREIAVQKCSQVGISELSVRRALALANIIEGYTIIYTLPTAHFAATFVRTRIDPVIDSSEFLKGTVHRTTDNAEVKRFGESFIYTKGSASNNAPISIPADELIHDELNFSDQDVISQYHSRLTHSRYRRKFKLSTPTLPGYGISEEFQNSRRHFNMVKCHHCNHWFVPDYYEHVKVPGYTGSLADITKSHLFTLNVREAYVVCPRCGKAPSLQVDQREWVCENPGENFVTAGYQVSPFDAPNIVSAQDLIVSSTNYAKRSDFDNYGLGKPSADKDSTILREDMEALFVQNTEVGGGMRVMGIDMGLVCHVMVGVVTPDVMIVIHSEKVPLGKIRERRKELAQVYWPAVTVMDSQPYAETLLAVQQEDPNLYGAVYIRSRNIEMFTLKKEEEDQEVARLSVRQVNINRDKAFDGLMADIRARSIIILDNEHRDSIVAQCTDMKRVKEYTADNELVHVWRKSKQGDDHFHHTLLYTWVAARMRGASEARVPPPFYVAKFRVKDEKEKKGHLLGRGIPTTIS